MCLSTATVHETIRPAHCLTHGSATNSRLLLRICQKISQYFESASVEDGSILGSRNELALFLELRGHTKDEAAIERCIVRKHQLWHGEDHPDTLASMSNLASTGLRYGATRWEECLDERMGYVFLLLWRSAVVVH